MIYLGNDPVGLTTSIPKFANIAKIECGDYTPTTDISPDEVSIPHSLGEIPDFFCYYCDDIEGLNNYQYTYVLNGFIYPLHYVLSGINQDSISQTIQTKINSVGLGYSTTLVNMNAYANNTSFIFMKKADTDRLKANITYHYVVGKFKEVTSNANE